MYIYLITNLTNFKKYVGYTKRDPIIRWKEHMMSANKIGNSKFKIHQAIAKYGRDTFSFRVIDTCVNPSEGKELEKYYISELDTFKNGYNSTLGGDGTYGIRTLAPKSEEHKRKIGLAHKGKLVSSETKSKLSKSASRRTGNKNSMFGKIGILNKRCKKVIQIDKNNGEEIAIYFSAKEAAKEMKVNKTTIQKAVVNNFCSCGYYWRYV